MIFGFVVYEFREQRDEVNATVHKEMKVMAEADELELPFGVDRMAYGGFEPLVEYQAEATDIESLDTTSKFSSSLPPSFKEQGFRWVCGVILRVFVPRSMARGRSR